VDAIRIGMIGCGVVGQGVMRILSEHADTIQRRLGSPLEVRRIVVRDLAAVRRPEVPRERLSTDVNDLLADPEIDLIIEVMGGVEPAGSYVRRALESGKSVVTANKALLAAQAHPLIELAEKKGADLYFEAAVAGGVPVIRTLREALASDRILAVRGIINGTSNYILSRMREAGLDFAGALAEAQRAGYAEADPTLDVGGGDAAHKLTILATLAYGAELDVAAIHCEGIEQVTAEDIRFAERFGFVIKPLAVARQLPDGSLDLRVHPALVDRKAVLASVGGALNAVRIDGAAVGPSFLSGLGAGAMPTAVSVVSDVIDAARNLHSDARSRVPQRAFQGAQVSRMKVQSIAEHRCRFYLRFSVRDRSGVLGRIASRLGEHDVSIEQMVQEGHGGNDPVSVVILTHPAREGSVRSALAAIDGLGDLFEPTRALRIEEG
jgi:homoserine dehydrogenase